MTAKKGITLVEIIIVLSIIGLVAAFLLPNITTSIEQTNAQAARNNLLAISAAQAQYYADRAPNPVYCVAGCADNKTQINTNLRLSISTNDRFTYSCVTNALTVPTTYTCTANDLTDNIQLSVNVANNAAVGVNILCTPIGANCPF